MSQPGGDNSFLLTISILAHSACYQHYHHCVAIYIHYILVIPNLPTCHSDKHELGIRMRSGGLHHLWIQLGVFTLGNTTALQRHYLLKVFMAVAKEPAQTTKSASSKRPKQLDGRELLVCGHHHI